MINSELREGYIALEAQRQHLLRLRHKRWLPQTARDEADAFERELWQAEERVLDAMKDDEAAA